ncbi:hypothetical protein Tco_1147916 [Tanacetum coccineum]
MAISAPVISISSDSSDERVPIAPADPLVAPEVGAVSVISPTKVLNLVDYSSFSHSDPSEDSLPVAPELPLVSPFLSSDHSKADNFTSDSSSSGLSSDSSSNISSGSSLDSLLDSSSVHSLGCDASDSSSKRSLDSSSPSGGPSRKSCRSSTTLIGTADAETVADFGISNRVRAPAKDGLGMGVEVATSDIREYDEEFKAEASAGGTIEIVVDPLVTGGIFEPTKGDAPGLEGTIYDISLIFA